MVLQVTRDVPQRGAPRSEKGATMSLTDDVSACASEVPRDEGRQLLDEVARKNLGMTAEEFLTAWDAGRFADNDSLAVHEVAALVPFGR